MRKYEWNSCYADKEIKTLSNIVHVSEKIEKVANYTIPFTTKWLWKLI